MPDQVPETAAPPTQEPVVFAATFSYKITGARTATVGTRQNVVKQVEWELTGTQDGQSFTLPQTTTLPDPDGQPFIEFEQLTQVDIIGWLEAVEPRLVGIKMHIQSVLDKMVEKASLTQATLPWQPPQPAAPEAAPSA